MSAPEHSAPGRVVVIGVGHRDRADDGIGPAVVDALGHRTDAVTTLVREGDLAVLPLLWDVDDDVVVVDALAGGAVGRLVELDPDDLAGGAALSTHGLGLADAVVLARRLHCLPRRLRVFGVTGAHFGYGPMSRTLHGRIDALVDELMLELGIAGDVAVHDSA